ncbi:hypothetical protein Peur_047616 [Populus x canadensis]
MCVYQVCLIRSKQTRRRDWTKEKARSGLSKSQEFLQVSPEETVPPCSDRHDLVSPSSTAGQQHRRLHALGSTAFQ